MFIVCSWNDRSDHVMMLVGLPARVGWSCQGGGCWRRTPTNIAKGQVQCHHFFACAWTLLDHLVSLIRVWSFTCYRRRHLEPCFSSMAAGLDPKKEDSCGYDVPTRTPQDIEVRGSRRHPSMAWRCWWTRWAFGKTSLELESNVTWQV